MIRKIFSAALAAALLWAGSAAAADTLQLSSEAFQEKAVTGRDGKKGKELVPVTTVVPGTEVIYVITYKNVGSEPAAKVVITNPVPKELEFKSGSAKGASSVKPEVSVDGGNTWGALNKLRVAGADGKPRPAQGADVTHVRWTLGFAVKPGAEGKVTYRAKLK